MNPKKILLSAYACSPIRGSEPGNGWSWAAGLAAKGFEVWCFTNVEDEKEILEASEKSGMPNLHFVFVRMPFIDKYFLDTGSKKIYLHYALWRRKAARIAQKMHAEIHFDIAHHVTFGSLQQGNFLWKLKDIKIIFGPVGGGQKALPVFKDYFGNAWKTEKIRDWITGFSTSLGTNFKNSILKSDFVLVSNKETFQLAQNGNKILSEKIKYVLDSVVPSALNDLPYIPNKNSKVIKLLWVGRILPRKGLNLVLESLSRLPEDMNYEFIVVGGGEWFHKVEGWIEQYGIDRKKIKLTGQIPYKDVIEYYKSADVFIFCSLRDSFGSQLLEAMAYSLPIITLNINGQATGVPDECGIKVTPETKEQTLDDIKDAIIKMYSDPDYREACARASYSYSKNNRWSNRIDEIVSNYYL